MLLQGDKVFAAPFDDVAAMNALILADVPVGQRLVEVIDRELAMGAMLHEARIVGYKLTGALAYVYVRYTDHTGAMRAGRLIRVRGRRVEGPGGVGTVWESQPANVTGPAVFGSWWSGLLVAAAKRGALDPGFCFRVDLLAASLPQYTPAPIVATRRAYSKAKNMHAGAVACAASPAFYGASLTAAQRFATNAGAVLAAAESSYIAAGGSV